MPPARTMPSGRRTSRPSARRRASRRRRQWRGCAATRDRSRPPARKIPDTRSLRRPRSADRCRCLLFGGSVPHERGPDPVDAHVLRAAGFVVRPHLLAQHGLLPYRTATRRHVLSATPGPIVRRRRAACRTTRWSQGLAGRLCRRRGSPLGYAWLSTSAGVFEVDGVGAEVVIHRHPFGNPSSLSAMMLRWISDVPP